jgi:hypothetical protein
MLLDYCRRKLAPDTAAFLERHMASCARCRAFRDGQMALWRSLDEWESMPVSGGFDRRLYGRIGEGRGNWWSLLAGEPRSGSARMRPALPFALAGVLVLVGLLVNDRPLPVVPREAVDAEQVESVLEDIDMLRVLTSAQETKL